MTEKVAARDAEGTRAGLEAWFSDQGFDTPSVNLLPGPAATGHSHESIVFEVASGGATERFVARLQPNRLSVFPKPDLRCEYQLLEEIATEDILLPALRGFESSPEYVGAPFYVMECVEGEAAPDRMPYTMAGWVLDASPDERARVWWSGLAAMTKPHLIGWENRLEFVNGSRTVGIDGEIEYWESYIDFLGRPIPEPAERAWRWLVRNKPARTTIALCWGDSRIGNQLFKDGHCVALLDWEMACLSDPIQDLAWFIHFDDLFSDGLGVARLEGIPARDETIGRYEDLTGFGTENFDYYEIFAAFRFVVILERLGRIETELGGVPVGNFASSYLEKLLAEKGIP